MLCALICTAFLVNCSKPSAGGGDLAVAEPDVEGAAGSGRQLEEPVTYRLASASEQEKSKQLAEAVDPNSDGWTSEAFHEETSAMLKLLGKACVKGESLEDFFIAAPASDKSGEEGRAGFASDGSAEVFSEAGLRVRRMAVQGRDAIELTKGDMIVALQQVRSEFGLGTERASGFEGMKFKQFEIEFPPADSAADFFARTSVFVNTRGVDDAGARLLENMEWKVQWQSVADPPAQSAGSAIGNRFAIQSVTVLGLERISNESGPMFRDRTGTVLGGLAAFHPQIMRGANHWTVSLPSESGRSLVGIAIGDANGDGIDDVFSSQGEGRPNLYFLSQPDGSLAEVGAPAGLDWVDATASALFADFDNDGDQDLAVAASRRLVFLRNEGDGLRFKRCGSHDQEDSSALSAADFDGDGLLDVFAGNYLADDAGLSVVKPDEIYNAASGGKNRLLRNLGELTFEDVTDSSGVGQGATRLTLAASWEDFDDDGDADLYVANDFGPNALYRNDGGRFVDIATVMGVDDPSTGMSISWGDADSDGRMDAYIGNMFSAAGNRITAQPAFARELDSGLDLQKIRYLARGNSLFIQRKEAGGGATFLDRSNVWGVRNSQWTWSALFADCNNDTRPDLLAVNGFISGPDEEDL